MAGLNVFPTLPSLTPATRQTPPRRRQNQTRRAVAWLREARASSSRKENRGYPDDADLQQTHSPANHPPSTGNAPGINRSRFHDLRHEFLDRAAGLLEPRQPGPKPNRPTEAQLEIERLQREIVRLKLDLKATQIREEIALVMPQLLVNRRDATAGKKTRRQASPKDTPGGS